LEDEFSEGMVDEDLEDVVDEEEGGLEDLEDVVDEEEGGLEDLEDNAFHRPCMRNTSYRSVCRCSDCPRDILCHILVFLEASDSGVRSVLICTLKTTINVLWLQNAIQGLEV